MKKLIGTIAVAAAVLFAGYGLSTPASASTATPSATINTTAAIDKANAGNTDISARRRHHHWHRSHHWHHRHHHWRPRAYYRPYYAPRRHYGYGYGYGW